MEEKCILHVVGHWQKNTSYLEEANGSGYIDRTYELVENTTIDPWGHTIKIVKINTDSVELSIDDEKVTLKESDRFYIVYKNETSGKNEDFKVDSEDLFIELLNVRKHYYPHLINFIDNKDKIDKNIEKVAVLIKHKYTYYQIQQHLKMILFRLTDKEYLKKVNEDKVDFLINERNLALPYKDIIIELINDIDIYFEENNKLIDIILKNKKLDSEEYKYISHYLCQLAMEQSSYDKIPFDRISRLCSLLYDRKFEVLYTKIELTEKEMIEICYFLMKITCKDRFYFENKYIANDLADYLLKIDETMFNYHTLINFNVDIADYYLQLHDRPKAMKYYLNASLIAKRNNDLKEAAYALSKYYKLNNAFPEELKVNVDINQINEEYKEFANIIIQAINYKPLKVCKSEFNPTFIENYFLVMREVEKIIDETKDLHIPFQRWDLIKKIYKEKYDIDWKNPKEMNPKVMFD